MKGFHALSLITFMLGCSFAFFTRTVLAITVVNNIAERNKLAIMMVYDADAQTGNVKSISSNEYGGLGKIVLEKNIINGTNFLTQEMLSSENTIYVIQQDYDLFEDIVVPINSTLRFDGGSITGKHSICGTNTRIEAGLVQIFGTNTIFTGTWNVNELNIKWFGAKGDNKSNDTQAFKNCIESPAVAQRVYKVLINPGIYLVDNTIYLPRTGIFLTGASREQMYYSENFTSCIKFIGENKDLFRIKGNTRSITIEKLGLKSYRQEGVDYKNNIAIKAMPETSNTHTTKNITIRDCHIVGFGYGFYVSGIKERIDWQCDNEVIENCTFEYYAKGGIYMNSRNCFDYALIKSCSFCGRPMENDVPAYGLDIKRCGFFKMEGCAGTVITENVKKGSLAATNSAAINISDLSAVGNIVLEQVQFESIPRFINVYNVSGGSRSITFNNSVFDAPLLMGGRGNYYFNECDFNSDVLIAGNDISLYNVPVERITLTNNNIGINSFDYLFSNKSNRTLYIRDLLLLKSVNTTEDQLLNPHSQHYIVKPSSSEVRCQVINTMNPFKEIRAIKVYLWGEYTIGIGGYINVKAKVDNGGTINLGTLTENDKVNGCVVKEYSYCSRLINPAANYFYLDTKNVTGSFDIKVEVLN